MADYSTRLTKRLRSDGDVLVEAGDELTLLAGTGAMTFQDSATSETTLATLAAAKRVYAFTTMGARASLNASNKAVFWAGETQDQFGLFFPHPTKTATVERVQFAIGTAQTDVTSVDVELRRDTVVVETLTVDTTGTHGMYQLLPFVSSHEFAVGEFVDVFAVRNNGTNGNDFSASLQYFYDY